MPVPTISQPATPRFLARGAVVSTALSATNAPTSWSASTLPPGLSINSSGVISGTATTVGYYASSITASNEDGTSAAVAVAWLVTEGAVGAVAGSMSLAIDWDLADGKLALSGVTGFEPAAEPVAASEVSSPILSLKVGDVMVVSLGLLQQGVLQEPTGITDIFATLRLAEDESSVLSVESDSTAITVTGSGTTARHEITIDLDHATLSSWLADDTYVPALLEFRLATGHAVISSLNVPVWLFRPLH